MAAGDIGSVIEAFTFDASFGDEPEIIHIDGDVYAIVYTGPDSDGFIITVSIDSAGDIGASIIDTLEFDGTQGLSPSICHVSGNVYAIAYSGPDSDGFVRTFSIDAAGNIGGTHIDSLEFETGTCREPIIKHISGQIYAVAYRGTGDDGWVCTFTINAGGGIGAAIIDDLEFDAAYGYEPKLIHVSGQIYAVAYRGTSADGYLVTFSISGIGEIGASVIDSYEFDTDMCYVPDIIKISTGIFAIAYFGPDFDGFIFTVAIAAGGNITAAKIDTLEFDTSEANWPSICLVAGDIYAIAYTGSGSDGFLVTLSIDEAGDISAAVIDSLEFDTTLCHQPALIRITTNVYAIAYQAFDESGVLKTISIEPPVVGGPKHLPLMGIG
jgi:hypothetical protein